MPLSRSEMARRIARSIACRVFRGYWDRSTLLNDAESVSWELESTAPPHVTPGSIGFMAVRRVLCGRQHKESIRSILTGKHDRRSKRPKLQQVHIRLTDLASRDTSPSDCVPGWMDFQVWLSRYDQRKRAIATALAIGGKTGETAKEFGLSPGRIAQYRREFEADYADFQRET